MRKQSQLADLIAGSGLVSGVARRASSQDGVSLPSQPVLYHFGARAGSSSARDHRDRPPLPSGHSSTSSANPHATSSGGGRPPTGAAWSSPHGTPNATVSAASAEAAFSGPNSGGGASPALQHRSGDVAADIAIATTSASHPLPQLGIVRSNSFGPEVPSGAPHSGSGFLPAVACYGDVGQAALDVQQLQAPASLPSPPLAATTGPGAVGPVSGGGAGPAVSQPDPRTSNGGGGGSTSGGWTFYGGPALLSGSPLPSGEYGGDGRPPTTSVSIGGGSMGGAAELVGAAGAWQAHVSAGGAEGSSVSGSVTSRSFTTGGAASPSGTRNVHSGGRTRAYGGGGGGFSSKQRWVRPSSTSHVGSSGGANRSSSETAARPSPDAAGIALAMSVQGAWSATAAAADGSLAAGGGNLNGGSCCGGGSGNLRSSRAGPLSAGAAASAELVVVVEEDSSLFDTAAGGGAAAGAGGDTAAGVGCTAAGTGARSNAAGGAQGGFAAAAASSGSSSLPSPYAGPSGVVSATAASATAGGTAAGGGAGSLGTAGTLSSVVPPLTSISTANELAELRRMVAELNGQVARLTAQLRDSELSAAQLQSMAAAAVASEREAAEMEAGRRHMKALRAAEAARDKAEAGRRGAEKRAKAAEEELAATREKLESKAKQAAELEAAVAAAQASLDKQCKAHEEALEVLEGQHKAQSRKQHHDADAEKKALHESMAKMQSDMAKRNQTVLALQADLEGAQADVAARDKQLEELRQMVAELQAELERERDRGRWLAEEARAEAERQQQQQQQQQEAVAEEVPSSLPSRVRTTAEAADAAGNAAAVSAPPASPAAAAAISPPQPARRASFLLPGGSVVPAGGGGGGGGGLVMDEQSRAIRKMQTEVAAIREEYAKRLVEMDDAVAAAEANMRDGVQGLERMFNVLVSRTAAILAGRLGIKGGFSAGKGSARPGTPVGRPSTAAASAAATAGANNAVLHMNERLASENAQLLAELSRWQSGRHAMLRKLNMVVLGADPPAPAPPALTHQQKIAQALAAVTGQAPPAPAPAAAATPAGAAAPAPRFFQYQKNFTGTPPPASAAAAAAADTAMTAAREALAAATRDSLLAGRKELLPAVMTAEGWGGSTVQGGWDPAATTQQLHGGKVESSLAAAESSLRLRTQLLALQAEVTRTRASGGEVVEKGREREALEEDHALAMADLRRELAAAKHQMSHMQRELERARAGINTAQESARGSANEVAERERLEDALSSARDDAARHKQVAAASKRELEARERMLEEAQLRAERLEVQLRDARSDAQRQGEGVKRLRLLLAQAKSLLKEQGVGFMDDDPGLELLLQAEKDKDRDRDKGGTLKGRNSLRPAASANPESDGPLFKALDAREREKEVSRLQSEVADLGAQLAAANKELKKVRKAAAAAAEAATEREREQRLQLASTIDSLAREAEAAKEATRAVQKQLLDSQHDAGELRRQVSDLTDKLTRAKLDGDYLRARAAAGRMKPKLNHARALSISISAAAAAPAGAEG